VAKKQGLTKQASKGTVHLLDFAEIKQRTTNGSHDPPPIDESKAERKKRIKKRENATQGVVFFLAT